MPQSNQDADFLLKLNYKHKTYCIYFKRETHTHHRKTNKDLNSTCVTLDKSCYLLL